MPQVSGRTYRGHVRESGIIDACGAVVARVASKEEADTFRCRYRGEEARDEWLDHGRLDWNQTIEVSS